MQYARMATSYDRWMAPIEFFWLSKVRREIFSELSGRVLEVGFGTGVNVGLHPPDTEVTAIDLEPRMVERGRDRPGAQALTIAVMDVQRLDFPDDTFDSAVSTLTFCGVADPVRGLREIYRTLKPGARLLMLEHTLGPFWIENQVLKAMSRLTAPHGEFFDRDIAGMLVEAGFVDVAAEHRALGTFYRFEGRKPA